MKALIIKMSSMGDLIHTLPAVTDAKKALPGIQFDWLVEEAFFEIPRWHPTIDNTIPIALRRWRKNKLGSMKPGELFFLLNILRRLNYDVIIDAQGLLKSALLSRLVKGVRHGMTAASCREPLAALCYAKQHVISKQAHAIERVRLLFAESLGYPPPEELLDYGLSPSRFKATNILKPYLVFLHNSSAEQKLWPTAQWRGLAKLALVNGYTVYLPWGNALEKDRAEEIAENNSWCRVLDKMNLTGLAGLLANASAVVGVDTGLAHLAAALSVPSITLYINTYPEYTGACGSNQLCMSQLKITPATVAPIAGLEIIYTEQLQAKAVWQQLKDRLHLPNLAN